MAIDTDETGISIGLSPDMATKFISGVGDISAGIGDYSISAESNSDAAKLWFWWHP